MTPENIKEKGDNLIVDFITATIGLPTLSNKQAIQCAIIAVEEVIKIDALIDEDVYVETPSYKEYWQQVLNYLKSKQ